MSETLTILLMKYLFMRNFASATLSPALQEVYGKKVGTVDLRERFEFLKPYILAYVLSIIESGEFLEELATRPAEYDPIFSFIMDLDFSELEKEYDKKISNEAVKKIKGRIKKAASYLKHELTR